MDKLKQRLQNADWWEIAYLIIYGGVFTFEFLNTTMFEVKWPPRFAYIFLASTALYVIAKFIWHNTYTKKEMIWAGIILFAFLMPALLTEYRFLWYTGFLIIGAKDVDFRKILKVYLLIAVTIMVVAFAASQNGIIEDLKYVIDRGDGVIRVRHSYGIIYPTDYAAHIFYMVLAFIVLIEKKLNLFTKVWICLLVAASVYMTSNAQTTMLCLVGFAGLCVLERVFRRYMGLVEKVLRWTPVACAGGFIGMAYAYDKDLASWSKLNLVLSNRLEISHKALDMYDVKLFGQNIGEVGSGAGMDWRPDYFFLDDSYIRILLKYGIILCIVFLVLMICISKRVIRTQSYLVVMTIVAFSIHSIMEHHILELAYNPMILMMFSNMTYEKGDWKEICIKKEVRDGGSI